MTAAADTSSLSYLAVLGLLDLFPRIFDRVVVPEAVILELQSPKAPLAVAELLKTPPRYH
jgi:predicted nucleic acid-binding protein